MQEEGMVHALEEIWRLLKPGGMLVDIHPVMGWSDIIIKRGGNIIYSRPSPENYWEEISTAENALDLVLKRGLFIKEDWEEFDFLSYADTVEEFRTFMESIGAIKKNTEEEQKLRQYDQLFSELQRVLGDAGEGVKLALHERGRVTRFRWN